MRVLKLIGAVTFFLLSLSMITPIYFLTRGLLTVEVEEPKHFLFKLFIEIIMMVTGAALALFLLKSAWKKEQ